MKGIIEYKNMLAIFFIPLEETIAGLSVILLAQSIALVVFHIIVYT